MFIISRAHLHAGEHALRNEIIGTLKPAKSRPPPPPPPPPRDQPIIHSNRTDQSERELFEADSALVSHKDGADVGSSSIIPSHHFATASLDDINSNVWIANDRSGWVEAKIIGQNNTLLTIQTIVSGEIEAYIIACRFIQKARAQ